MPDGVNTLGELAFLSLCEAKTGSTAFEYSAFDPVADELNGKHGVPCRPLLDTGGDFPFETEKTADEFALLRWRERSQLNQLSVGTGKQLFE